MDMKRFAELADAYGGDIERWPATERPAAQALAGSNPDAAAVLAEARRLDAILADADQVAPSDLLARRILKAAPAGPFDADWRRPAVAAAAALVIGVVGGFAGGLVLPESDESIYETEYADAFDGLLEDWAAWEWSDA